MIEKIVTSFIYEHDLGVLALAAFLALFCAVTCLFLLQRTRVCAERDRKSWLVTSALAVGSGIWATHMMASLGWDLHMPVKHSVIMSGIAGVLSIAIVGVGFALSTYNRTRSARLLAGLIVGAGIAVIHFVEMLAITVQGTMNFDPRYSAVATLVALTLSGAAMVVMNKMEDAVRQILAALLLAGAMIALHQISVAGVSVTFVANAPVPEKLVSDTVMSFAVSISAIALLSASLAMALTDFRLTRQGAVEVDRLRSLADAAIEGIVMIDHGGHIVNANESFLRLVGKSIRGIRGEAFTRYFRDFPIGQNVTRLAEAGAKLEEATLVSAAAEEIPTELYFKSAIVSGEAHNVAVVRDLREQRAAERRINYLANYDALTGLANRQLMMDRLQHAMHAAAEADHKVVLHYLDLDSFKEMNTAIGQAAADQLLKYVAGRLQSSLRGMVTLARIGADQFCVVQEGVKLSENAELLLERLRRKLEQPFTVAGKEIRLTACIGTAIAPDDADTPGHLLARAEIAMKKAKAAGRGTFSFYELAADKALEDRRKLKLELADALAEDQIFLLYQPQFDIDSGAVTGFEALARWRHPKRGVVSPVEFIPLAEESGLIVEIGSWIFREACREAAGWASPLRIAVNLSPVQFDDNELPEKIDSVLAECGLDPRRLELEITEGVLIEDEIRALGMLRRLKDKGIQLAMDDFGTGYSSLSYLRQFPFDKLKIDKSFITDLKDDQQSLGIVKGMIGLAHGLNIPVLAEGVENEAQLAMLRLEHGDEVQGFYTGMPKPISHYEALTDARKTGTIATPVSQSA
ncbi:bifunctional diguanylate cyclase/phosphodiesterase [Kordiimonas aestuarii]|uniref:bifunctional diguanylate cyclase/phosphodiesterase n=1 Tax=Kordiimonas aestuarii TaxID=1005925 RepID=UPI0021D1A405|nr:EAL domain-containing protein [Kordiimonas aestuarii]